MALNNSILRTRLFATREPAPATPAHNAHLLNRHQAADLSRRLEGKAELRAAIAAALSTAEAADAAPASIREQLDLATARQAASMELSVPCDTQPVLSWQAALTQAQAAAEAARPRVGIERAKLATIDQQLGELRGLLRELQLAHPQLAFDALWEQLTAKAAILTDAREQYVRALDEAFAVATAIDVMAGAENAPAGIRGKFASSGCLGELVLPLLPTMQPLPYTADVHHQRVRVRAEALLHELLNS